jgi:hypothetical protein
MLSPTLNLSMPSTLDLFGKKNGDKDYMAFKKDYSFGIRTLRFIGVSLLKSIKFIWIRILLISFPKNVSIAFGN